MWILFVMVMKKTSETLHVEKEIGGSVWAGTISLTRYLCFETSALAEDSAVARMVWLVEDTQTQCSNMDQLGETFAKFYTPTIVVAACNCHCPYHFACPSCQTLAIFGTCSPSVACPCALVISTPVTTTCAITQAARKGLLVKSGKYLEAIGRIKVVAMDKRGTLRGLLSTCTSGDCEQECKLTEAFALGIMH
ncbi:hypothetical protein L7F22_033405 [Adiantum nelumboides]|nr:hypothetical protein [Adiantum nelumboides]